MNRSTSFDLPPTLVFPTLTLLFGLQILRVLFPQMQYLLLERMLYTPAQVAVVGLVLFALAAVAPLFSRRLGLRRAIMWTAGGLGLARVAMHLWRADPIGDFVLALIGTLCFVVWLPLYLGTLRGRQSEESQTAAGFALALLLAFALDLGLHGVFLSYDFVWQVGVVQAVLAGILVSMQWAAMQQCLPDLPVEPQEAPLPRLWSVLALGPLIFLQLLWLANPARLTALTDWPFSIAFFVLGLAHVGGLTLATFWRPTRPLFLALGGTLLVLAFLYPLGGWLAAIVVVAAQLALAPLLAGLAAAWEAGPARTGIRNISLFVAAGGVLLLAFTFAHYLVFLLPMPYDPVWLLPLAAFILALGSLQAAAPAVPLPQSAARVSLAVLLMPFIVGLLAAGGPVTPTSATPLRVMTYNIHNGFDSRGHLGLEALALEIETAEAEVVALQEVSRGWVVNGAGDTLSWLAARLDMNAAFIPTSDPLWGVAVLSKYPIRHNEAIELPPRNLPLNRSAQWVEIDLGSGPPLMLINTHLHARAIDTFVRDEQMAALTGFLTERELGAERLIVLGDFNAPAPAAELGYLFDLGLENALADVDEPFTFPATEPRIDLDHIFVSPDWRVRQTFIPDSTASDHRPVMVVLD